MDKHSTSYDGLRGHTRPWGLDSISMNALRLMNQKTMVNLDHNQNKYKFIRWSKERADRRKHYWKKGRPQPFFISVGQFREHKITLVKLLREYTDVFS